MDMKKVSFLFFVMFCSVLPLWAQREIYVSVQGDDAAEGTAVAPVRTIAHALELADDSGSVIRIAYGSYTETVTLELRSNLTMEGGIGYDYMGTE